MTSLFNTNADLIMFGTSTAGFGVIDLNATMFHKLNLGREKSSYFITKQADDTLWLSTKTGVLKVNPDYSIEGPWHHREISESLNKMRSIVFDDDNQLLWVASGLGLGAIKLGSDVIENVAFEDAYIYSTQVGPSGNLWVGTRNQGLNIWNLDNNEIIKNYDIPMALHILSISKEEVWVATIGGLYFINPTTSELRKFVNEKGNENSIVHDVVTWVSQRDKNSFYVGTQGHGLHLLELDSSSKEAKFSPLFSNDRLSNSSIGAVVEDKNGVLWMSSEKYIYRANPETGDVDVFDENDGVNTAGYYIGAFAVKNDGTIFFVGDAGVTYFNPEKIKKSNTIPNLQFTRVAILNSEDSHGIEAKFGSVRNLADSVTKVVLSPDDILLSIEFAALEFGSPQSIEYAYRLIGFDDRWQYLDSKNRTVTYTNLDAGSYIFEVKSTNRYGIWSEKPQRMPIVVTPPWWRTTFATLVFALVFLLFIFVVYRWRTYALHSRSKMLYKSVQEKTIELQRANEQLTLLTTLDPLTQVYNRRGFTDAVGKEFSKYRRSKQVFSVILIDIDFFKKINDEYGHEAGDQVLIRVASLLQECTRDYDILARWGGEEFIVLLPNTRLKDAISIANKYRETIRGENFKVAEHSIRVSLTAGVANIEDFESIDECIKRADSLLYEGKNLGRDQVLPML
jgi:diguanylate cyclase (GGDEF)-like protein